MFYWFICKHGLELQKQIQLGRKNVLLVLCFIPHIKSFIEGFCVILRLTFVLFYDLQGEKGSKIANIMSAIILNKPELRAIKRINSVIFLSFTFLCFPFRQLFTDHIYLNFINIESRWKALRCGLTAAHPKCNKSVGMWESSLVRWWIIPVRALFHVVLHGLLLAIMIECSCLLFPVRWTTCVWRTWCTRTRWGLWRTQPRWCTSGWPSPTTCSWPTPTTPQTSPAVRPSVRKNPTCFFYHHAGFGS